MAITGAYTDTTLGDILLRVYAKGRVEQLQNIQSDLMGVLPVATNYTIGGDDFRFGVNAEGDELFGFIDEDATLPDPSNESVQQANFKPKVFAGQIIFTGLARAISARDEHSFVSAITYAADQKLKRMNSYREGCLFRDGTGDLGLANGAGAAVTTFVMDTPGVQWIRAGMKLDVIDSGDAVDVDGIVVDSVDWTANTFEWASAQTWSDNARVFPDILGQSVYAGTVKEITGLDAALATSGTYLGLSRTTYPTWKSNVVDASSAELSEDLLLRTENQIVVVGGVPYSDVRDFRLIWHPNQRRQFFKLSQAQKQYTGLALDPGYSKLTWNGHEAIETYNCPETAVYIGDLSMFQHFVAPGGEMQIDNSFGAPVKWKPNYDAGVMYWRCYDEYAVRKPNACARLHTLANVATR